MAFNALLKSASKPGDPSSSENWSLGIEANPTYTQWSGQISGPRYTVRDASLGRMTFEKPRVQVRLLPGGLWEGTLSAAALQWNQELLPALRAEMKYREQHLEATLSLQDQAQYLQATLDARMVQNQIQKLNLNGRMDFKLPPLAGLCYPLHAQGDFEGTYDAKGGKVNTLNAQWKQGAISCPEQIIPIEHATFSWNRMANQGMSQCAITWDQDSVHTQGLDELEDVSVALGQIGNFLIGDNQVRGDHNPFWAFARINNLGKYLALLEAKPAIEGNHVQVFANWTQPSQRSIRLDAQQVSWSTFYSPKITIRTENLGPYMLVQANLDSLTNQKQVLLDRINFQQIRDSLGSVLSLKGNHSRQGTEVLLRGHLQADANTWNLLVDSLELHASAQHWTARPGGQIIKRGDRWELLGLNLQSGVSGMNFQGVLSDLPSDQLRMTVRDFDLGQLLSAFGQPAGWLNGIISGDVTAGSVLQEPTFSGNLKMENLAIDSIPLGLMEWSSTFDPGANRLQLQGLLSSDNLELASVKGWIQTDQEGLPCQLEGKLSRIPLQLLEMFLLPHLDSIRGQARATVQWGGFLSKPELRGFLVLENGSLYIPYLKNTYRFNDTVWVEPDRFLFARVPVQDKDRGNALLKGQVNHRNFREWGYGFLCDSIQNLLVLQEPRLLKGDAYHGLGRVSGQAQITGDEYLTDLQANLISQKGSRLVIPLDDLSSEEQQDFVRFVTNQDDKDLEDSLGFAGKQIALRGIDLKISLALNPETEISLLLDRRFGDQIKGVGNGKLDLTYTKEGNLSLAGNYLFTKGEYAFNLGNLASKNFSIQEGSRIDWNGDPYDGVMKINAIYKQRASVRNLLTGSAASTDRRNMVPVETHLGLNGPILKPEVHFQIKLPTVNSSDPNDILVQQINRINNNEQELNNQVLGLMVSGQFIPEENMSSANLGINTGATAFNSVTELLTNRLSNLLNNSLGGGVNLGINYRGDLGTGLLAGNGAGNLAADSNRRDLNVALNTTLFNNRLTIDGNLAMGNSLQVNAQNMAGEIQIEYKVNPSGTIRAKAFNRLDDRVLFNQTLNYRQGLGISYNRNFDRWGELFRRQSKSQKRP
jgi:hypothetical protein